MLRVTIANLMVLSAFSVATAVQVSSVRDLNAAIAAAPDGETVAESVGVLSQGNFDAIKHLLPDRTKAVVYDTVEAIVDAVIAGDAFAGLTTNRANNDAVVEFGAEAVAVRGFMFKKAQGESTYNPIQSAINGAVVHLAESSLLRNLKQQYYHDFGVDTVEVRTCAGTTDTYHEFAESVRDTTIRIGGLGPYDWGNLGDYLADPPTGFFPEYMNLMKSQLRDTLNVTLEWQWYGTSQETMEALDNDEFDCTDVYWTQPALYELGNRSVSRVQHFDWSCAVLGTDSNFFVKREVLASGDSNDGYSASTIGGIVAGCIAVLFIAVVVIIILIRREKVGDPIFGRMTENSALVNADPTKDIDSHTSEV